MDLRERASWNQRLGETIIRFRLILIPVVLLLWWLFGASWKASVAYLLLQANGNALVLTHALSGQMPSLVDFSRVVIVLVLLVLVRARTIGWKAAMSTLWFVAAVLAGCWVLDGTANILPALLGAILFTLVTLLFFGRSAWFICSFAFALSIFLLASWLPGVAHGVGVGWQLLLAVASADLAVQIAVIRSQLKSGHPAAGAVVKANMAIAKGVLASALVFAIVDAVCFSLGFASLLNSSILGSVLGYVGYLLFILLLAPALFSLSPLGRIQVKKSRYHKA